MLDRFELEDCERNPCSEIPCQNGGTCQVQKMGFQCQCKAEFTGKTRDFQLASASAVYISVVSEAFKALMAFTMLVQIRFFSHQVRDVRGSEHSAIRILAKTAANVDSDTETSGASARMDSMEDSVRTRSDSKRGENRFEAPG